MISELLKIKDIKFKHYNRKTGEFDKIKSVFANYKVLVDNDNRHTPIRIQGPKVEFLLIENHRGLRTPGGTVRFFRIYLNKKIQGCNGFVLNEETRELVPFVAAGSWGDAAVKELKGFEE